MTVYRIPFHPEHVVRVNIGEVALNGIFKGRSVGVMCMDVKSCSFSTKDYIFSML